MRNYFIVLFFVFCFLPHSIKAQDSLRIIKNQVYVEILGNNFADFNSSADAGLISINYCRKVIFKKNSWMFSFGIGPLKASGYDSINRTATDITIIDFPVGFFWRPNYKRNGFWAGVYFTTSIGEISYIFHDYDNHAEINYTHNSSFQISPNLTYQFQSRSEHFFCRLTFSPKILPSIFSEKYGDYWKVFPLWGGICIGGAW